MTADRKPGPPAFDGVEQVVSDNLKFKKKLGIGEDSYASVRLGRTISDLWEVGGVAAAGGGAAASGAVAGTFFASGGWLSAIGLGAVATTPVGWVVGTALATGAAYYGVRRMFRAYRDSRVDVIPKFINTPIDLLGASLMDMLAGLGFKIAQIDGHVSAEERRAIRDYFVEDWGFDPDYADRALPLIEEGGGETSIKEMAAAFAAFVRENPDCRPDAARAELASFLREVASADGRLDEREDLAIEKIERILDGSASILAKPLQFFAKRPAG